jgi:hypothetical protein
VIAVRNHPSQRVFAKVGFRAVAAADLLLYEITGRVPRPVLAGAPVVRSVGPAFAPVLAPLAGQSPDRAARLLAQRENVYLLALDGDRPLGYAELLYVRTLQYEGFWMERVAIAAERSEAVAHALCASAIEAGKVRPEAGVVGILVSPDDRLRRDACIRQGFACVEQYRVYERALELDGQ